MSGCPRAAGESRRRGGAGVWRRAGPGAVLWPAAGQGRAGTRFSAKRLNDSHGQVRNNLLEGDASSYTPLAGR